MRVFAVLMLLGVLASVACADTVIDPRGVFADVTVVAMDDGKLVFRFSDGRTVSRSVIDIREISLATRSDAAADELSRAESLHQEKRYPQAAALYERARDLTAKDWVRAYATFRLVDTYVHLNRLADAVDAYLQIVDKHSALITSAVPRPDGDSPEAARVLADLQRREASATEPQRRAIAMVRQVLGVTEPPAPPEKRSSPPPHKPKSSTRPAHPSKPIEPPAGAERGEPASRPAQATRSVPLKKMALPLKQRATADVYEKLDAGQRVEAWQEIEAGLKHAAKSAPASRDVWWLAEAEYELRGGQMLPGALAAMRIIAIMPDSPYFAEALVLAGRGYESTSPDKSRSLYAEAGKHATASAAIKRVAADRLAALDKAAATQRSAAAAGEHGKPRK